MKIVALHKKSLEEILHFEKKHAPGRPIYYSEDYDSLMRMFNNPLSARAYGVYEKGKLIAWGSYEEPETGIYKIRSLVVSKYQRSKGIGGKILDKLLSEIYSKNGIREIFLTVYPENRPALALYLRRGFVIKEKRDNMFGPGEHRLILTLNME